MQTRKATAKKTPPAKKPAAKTQAEPTTAEKPIVKSPEAPIVTPKRTPTPKSTETKRTPTTRSKKAIQAVSTDANPSPATAVKESPSPVGASNSTIDTTPISSSAGDVPGASGINATPPSTVAVGASASNTEANQATPLSSSGAGTPISITDASPAVEATNTPDDAGQTSTGQKRKVKVVRTVIRKVLRKVPKGTLGNTPKSQEPEKPVIEENPEKLVIDENPEKLVIDENPEKLVIDENPEKNAQLETAGSDPETAKGDSISSENVDKKSLNEESTVVVNAVDLTEAAKRAEVSVQTEKVCAEISSKHLHEPDIVAVEVNSMKAMDYDKQQNEALPNEEQEGEPKAVEVQVELMDEQGDEPKAVEVQMELMEEQGAEQKGVEVQGELLEEQGAKQKGVEVQVELMEEQNEEPKAADAEAEWNGEKVAIDEEPKEGKTDFDSLLEEADDDGIADPEFHDEVGRDDSGKSMLERCEEAMKREEEHDELNASAQERMLRKEFEIFVGGLDREVVEEDLKRVFQHAGEVVDVRLYKDPATNKNKGYGFVRFAAKEHVVKALAEMKNPVIRGKRCGTAPSEGNDTLFVGNICNTWTKEAIKQKLKDYGLKSVEGITLVTDPKHEGLSRGFAFVEFSCHAEAVKAFNRLQKPDAVFGHAERTAKVAFAEPLREPDPEVMAKVKTVFIDGLPPHWDEDHVRQEVKGFGEIEQILLARNMSSAKRKDFGFVDFTTHDAAVACIEGINNSALCDGNDKAKVWARLANPEPKIQAVKGEMVGGFRIAQSSGGTFPRHNRGYGRGGNAFNRGNFHSSQGFFPRGPDNGGYMAFGNGRGIGGSYPPFHDGQNFGRGERWGFRNAPPMPPLQRPPLHYTPNLGRGSGGVHDAYRRPPFMPGEGFERPFLGRQFDDPYLYDDSARGVKRPYQMNDQNTDYMGPSNRRPRYDYAQPPASHHHGGIGPGGSGPYPRDHHDYGRETRPSYYGGGHSYGRGYYY